MTRVWPDVLKPRSIKGPELRNAVVSGGRTLAGTEQRLFNDAGHWEVSYTIPIRRREQVLAWRALKAHLRAGGDVLLKVFDLYWPDGARNVDAETSIAAPAALRSTVLSVNTTADIEIGTLFGIGDRLHQVQEVTAEAGPPSLVDIILSDALTWDDGAGWIENGAETGYTLKILPPLRAAAASGTPIKLVDLAFRCDLASMDDGDMDLDLGRRADVTVTFKEAF